MSFFEKPRWAIFTQRQHPLIHSLSDFYYVSDALPGVTNIESALNWIVKVLYPRTQDPVATPAALPLLGNTINDYRVVLDDGDGKQAGYRWEQREGDASPSWYKIYDFDWSTDAILSALTDIASDLYVYQKGKTDLDSSGNAIIGTFAGQTIYGGNQANQNLTFKANSGDGTGASTGYIQIADNFRPTSNNAFDFGTSSNKLKDGYFAGSLFVSTMTLSGGSISDTSGTVSFNDEHLVTTGNITASIGYYTTSLEVGPLVGISLILNPGSITDESGAISFGNENLSTTGTVAGASGSVFGDITLGTGSITSLTATISFGSNNILTTGTLGAGDTTVTRLDSDNIRLDGNTISILNANGNLILQANGTGIIDIQDDMTTLGITSTGVVTVTGQLNADNIRIDGNIISATDLNGNIQFNPNGSGIVFSAATISPTSDNSKDLGQTSSRFKDLYLSGTISDGTNAIAMATLLSFKNALVGAAPGMSLFYDGTDWVASAPDTEIDHGTISGLLDDDHTQYMLLAGRAGGQSLVGGTAASESLILESTSNVTKGDILTKDDFLPFTNASYSGGWQGTDLGGSSNYFRDLYTKGELKGARLENFTSGTLPSFSAQNVGRVMYATDTQKAYVDTGSAIKVLGVSKFLSDTSWNGSDTTKDVTVSADISDARNSIWALHDNTNDFDRIYCSIKAISATQVRITVSPALPAGSYRLIGIE